MVPNHPQLQEKGIEPLAYKLFCFTAHYRTKLNFTFDTALATQKALMRLREGFVKHQDGTETVDEQEIKEYENKFLETINDDLSMTFDYKLKEGICPSSNAIKILEILEYPKEILDKIKKKLS